MGSTGGKSKADDTGAGDARRLAEVDHIYIQLIDDMRESAEFRARCHEIMKLDDIEEMIRLRDQLVPPPFLKRTTV
jgi:hypothetical protein